MRLKSSDSSNSWLWNSTPEPAGETKNCTQAKAGTAAEIKPNQLGPAQKKLILTLRLKEMTAVLGTRQRE